MVEVLLEVSRPFLIFGWVGIAIGFFSACFSISVRERAP